MNESGQRHIELKQLSHEFIVYSQPVMLMMGGKGGERAEAAQWSMEVQKLLRGLVETIIGLENMMDHTEQSKKLLVNNQEILLSNEKKYWLMIYLIDNGILRLYASLEKIAQMCRSFLEYTEHAAGMCTTRVGREKGIDVRIAIDMIRLANEKVYDVGVVFSQDQDLSEAVDEVKKISEDQKRWIKLVSVFPDSDLVGNRRGINHTESIRLKRTFYDRCIDTREYRSSAKLAPQLPFNTIRVADKKP